MLAFKLTPRQFLEQQRSTKNILGRRTEFGVLFVRGRWEFELFSLAIRSLF